ncbi:MAG: hypothetical protein K2O62_04480 [Clostridia bacterium]|nr:hypothetical protein [Clostridia bacterium]
MKDNQNVESKVTADTAEAEEKQAAAELGKFKDVKALAEAYRALEAEFTRRSQRLKELEEKQANKGTDTTANTETAANAEAPSQAASTGADKDAQSVMPVLSDEIKNAVIEEYLNGVCARRGVPFVTGGGAVAAQRRTPTTLKEAGALAGKLFSDKEDN